MQKSYLEWCVRAWFLVSFSSSASLMRSPLFLQATWKHNTEMEITFIQDKKSKELESKDLQLVLKVGKTKKAFAVGGTTTLELADFYRDGTKAEKIIPLSQGSNPTTLKLSLQTTWLYIDGKLIVRGKTGRPIQQHGEEEEEGEQDYDLRTGSFDSEDDLSKDVSTGALSEDEEGDNATSVLGALSRPASVAVSPTAAELESLKSLCDQLRGDLKQSEDKLDTYR